MGKPIEGSTKKALEGSANNSNGLPPTGQPTIGNAPDISGFEYVPSLRLYVSKVRELKGKNWTDCQAGLHTRGDRMPTKNRARVAHVPFEMYRSKREAFIRISATAVRFRVGSGESEEMDDDLDDYFDYPVAR